MSQESIIKFEVVAGIIIKDHKVLMCKTRDNEHYYNPGGKLKEGESYHQAMIREAKEELSIDLIPETIKEYWHFEADAYGFPEPRRVIMNTYTFNYSGDLKASGEITDIFFASSYDIDRLAPAAQVLLKKLIQDGLIK